VTLGEATSEAEDGKRTVHELKCWPAYFEAVARGDKNFEVRRDDRGFQKGDILALREWDPDQPCEGLQSCNFEHRLITYVLTGGQLGIEPGHVVLGLQKLDDE
jgi:hypothetical protein